jgi:hypothetical protein
LESPGVKLRVILKWILKELCVRIWTELIWLRVNDKLWVVHKKSLMNCFDKMSGIFWLAEKLAACQELLSHGVSQLESELYKAVAINSNICKQKLFLIQLKLKFPKHLSCYVEGTAQCFISHVTFWANISFSNPQRDCTLRKTKTVWKVWLCSMKSYIQTMKTSSWPNAPNLYVPYVKTALSSSFLWML